MNRLLPPAALDNCTPVRCSRCGAARGVCTDEAVEEARLAHRVDRWVGELARANVPCPRCCPLRKHAS